jgi:hypothetical protein
MLPGILAFVYMVLIVFFIRLVRSHKYQVEDEARDIPGSDMDINYCERPYIDKYI